MGQETAQSLFYNLYVIWVNWQQCPKIHQRELQGNVTRTQAPLDDSSPPYAPIFVTQGLPVPGVKSYIPFSLPREHNSIKHPSPPTTIYHLVSFQPSLPSIPTTCSLPSIHLLREASFSSFKSLLWALPQSRNLIFLSLARQGSWSLQLPPSYAIQLLQTEIHCISSLCTAALSLELFLILVSATAEGIQESLIQ